MAIANLKEKPVRVLARLAKQFGVLGWHSMRKDQLIRALVRKAKSRPVVVAGNLRSQAGKSGLRNLFTPLDLGVSRLKETRTAVTVRDAAVTERLQEARDRLSKAKLLTTRPENGRSHRQLRDRIVVMVRGPYWLHAFWEITPQSVSRAQAALGQEWHGAKPILRLIGTELGVPGSASEQVLRDIEVHGSVKNWFIDVRHPPLSCRVEVGYLSASGRFHSLARSNSVSTPPPSQCDTLDAHWGDIVDDCEKIYAMSGGFSSENNTTELQQLFEERLRRPMGPPATRRAGDESGLPLRRDTQFQLQVDAEMMIYGVTQPGAYVTLQGSPVKIRRDGTFRVRLAMPNKRQVIPIVASTSDGVEQQTVVLAVERNTKSMEQSAKDSC